MKAIQAMRVIISMAKSRLYKKLRFKIVILHA